METKTLPEFIAKIGDAEAADLFQVAELTAKSWRLRKRIPWPKQADIIVEKTADHKHGPVTYEGIVSGKVTRVTR